MLSINIISTPLEYMDFLRKNYLVMSLECVKQEKVKAGTKRSLEESIYGMRRK